MIRAHLINESHLRRHRLLIVRRGFPGYVELWNEERWEQYPEGVEFPPGAGIIIPADGLEAVAEAFHPFAGGEREIARLEEALTVERMRVERIIEKGLRDA